MSTSSGTATSYTDLLNKLVTFLTTDTTLTGLGQNWTEVQSNSTSYTWTESGTGAVNTVDFECILKAPGLGGTQSIYVGLQAYHNASLGINNWSMVGATGYNSSMAWAAQPGISPRAFMPLWNSTIPYLFVANGQRVIVVAQIGTVIESCYLGLINPYGTPSQYPYPLLIAGSSVTSNVLYSDSSYNHQAFFDPGFAYLYWVDGSWKPLQNQGYTGSPILNLFTMPYKNNAGTPYWLTTNLDGSYPLFPVEVAMQVPSPNMVGSLDGVYLTTGIGLSNGSTISVGGNTYYAVQNIFRTAANNFAAILEA